MPSYRFSLRDHYGNDREEVGWLALSDDDDARAFGRATIRDLLCDNPTPYVGWTMYVTERARLVGSLSIPANVKSSLPDIYFPTDGTIGSKIA
jgi:hypothetical protein